MEEKLQKKLGRVYQQRCSDRQAELMARFERLTCEAIGTPLTRSQGARLSYYQSLILTEPAAQSEYTLRLVFKACVDARRLRESGVKRKDGKPSNIGAYWNATVGNAFAIGGVSRDVVWPNRSASVRREA